LKTHRVPTAARHRRRSAIRRPNRRRLPCRGPPGAPSSSEIRRRIRRSSGRRDTERRMRPHSPDTRTDSVVPWPPSILGVPIPRTRGDDRSPLSHPYAPLREERLEDVGFGFLRESSTESLQTSPASGCPVALRASVRPYQSACCSSVSTLSAGTSR